MLVRPEVEADYPRIAAVIEAAFADRPYSSRTEARIVAALRHAGALSLGLVAERDDLSAGAISGQIVGHIAFSPVEISDGSLDWFGLGPVAVEPALQGQGIGSGLILAGLAELERRGARGCVLLGEPAYYERFGFVHDPALVYEGAPAEFFLARPFGGARAAGTVRYHAAFDVQ